MMSCPIETAKKYRYNWNKNFYVDYAWYAYRLKYMLNQAQWRVQKEYGSWTDYKLNELLEWIFKNDGALYKEDGVNYHKDLIESVGLQDYVKWSETAPSEDPPYEFTSNYKAGVSASSVIENNSGIGTYEYTDITKTLNIKTNRWHCIHKMTKPGVSSFDYPTYEMTETSKHVGKKAAGWAIAEVAGRINKPKYGDFDISEKLGGDWLCLGGTVQYNGEFWQASRTYQHSPDGWDNDIYKEGQVSK